MCMNLLVFGTLKPSNSYGKLGRIVVLMVLCGT